MIRSIFGSLIAASLLAFQQVQAGQVAQVIDATNFCTFMPPADSTDRIISNTEWNGMVFCMGNTPKATSSGTLPPGFIQSAHFVATDDYVQVTGQINPSKANLDLSDWGGQYDIKAPDGSSCAGYNYYVNLVEPASYTYCMRCCNSVANCNRGISEKGCAHIIPGDYSGPMDTSITAGTSGSNYPSTSPAVAPASSKASSTTTTTAPNGTTKGPAAPASSSAAAAAVTTTTSQTTSNGPQQVVASGSDNGNSSTASGATSDASIPVSSSDAATSVAAASASDADQSESVQAQSVDVQNAAGTIHPTGAAVALAVIGGLMMVAM